MADPFSIAAGALGIAAPAAHYVHLLLADVQNIVDAPETIKSLEQNLLSVDQALTSLKGVSDSQWKALGDPVYKQAEVTTASCKESCDRFRTALNRWTRHSADGKLSLRDRTMVGFFAQGSIKSISEQLQHCKISLTSVVCIATLHSSLQQKRATEEMSEMLTTISKQKAALAQSMITIGKKLAEMNAMQKALCDAKMERDETEVDRDSAVDQVKVDQAVLGESRKLLEQLLSGIRTAAVNARREQLQARVVNNFGDHNEGMQLGANHGTMRGFTFNAGAKNY